MKLSKRHLKRIIKEEYRKLLFENMDYLVAQAEEWIEYEGDDYDAMESFCAEMEEEGYDPSDCESAWETACDNLGV